MSRGDGMKFAPAVWFASTLGVAWPLVGNEPFSIVSAIIDDEALSRAHDVELAGDLAFVPGKGQSLAIVDVGDPEEPEILWYFNDAYIPDAETVLPVGDFLILGTRDFLTLDVSDPEQPRILKRIQDSPRIDRINGMVKVGDTVFTANKSGYVSAFEVGDPKDPAYLGSLETKERFGLRLPHDIDRYGDYLVVVDPAKFVPPVGRLGVIKAVRDGSNLPVDDWALVGEVSDAQLIGANRVQMYRNFAVVCGSYSPEGRRLASEAAGKPITAMVSIVDLADPTKPTVVASQAFPDDRGPNGLMIAGEVAFCAGGQTIAAYDLRNPLEPKLLGATRFPKYKIDAERTDNYHDLVYREGLLYVSAQSDNGFLIVRIEDALIRDLAESN